MPKDLYVGRSMDDLEKLCKVPDIFKQKPVNTICKSIGTVYTQANQAIKDDDEEMAYVFLMKYFHLLNYLKQAKDFKREEQFVRKLLGTNTDIRARMDRLQMIQASLTDRYEAKRLSLMPPSVVPTNDPNVNNNNLKAQIPSESSTKSPGEIKKSTGHPKSIECSELYQLIHDNTVSTLVMDCRRSNDFEASHLKYQNILNVPEEVIKKGLSAGSLAHSLDSSVLSMWTKRCIMERVILIDWHSKADNINDGPIWTLRDILLHWDPDAKYPYSIQIVNGGYEMFMVTYPMFTTDPKYKPNIKSESYDSVGDIEYPSLSDIKMKNDTPLKDVTNRARPNVDRSSKLAAEKTYESKWKNVEEIIKEKEQLIDRALEKEKEALKLEADLEQSIREEPTIDEAKRNEWYAKQTELQYKIMQYDNERDDNITQREELEEELGSITVDEIPTVDKLAAQRIREKEQERQLLELERKRKNEENERLMLAREREQKRTMKIHADELPTKAKQPMIDRSVKPILPSVTPAVVTYRNFAPEYGVVLPGLTGLKNLGNTCYMNSIIQCLSNVVELCKYFCSGHYRNHLNRKNETRGEISEEFAALCSELWSGKCRSISPQHFRYAFGQYKNEFSGYEQQDSHEFLTILIDCLHSELEIPSENSIPIERLKPSEKAWREFLKDKQSFVMKQFYGQTRSTVKCRVCQHESATYEGFSNLSFELPQHSRQSDLKECMDMYFDGEKISGWFCPKCKRERDAIKKLDISKVPPVLVVHLKRFEFDLTTSMKTCRKIQNFIRFPIHQFNISDYVTLSVRRMNNPSNYNLCAVSNHYGTVDRGHYTAFCKNQNTNSWYKFDDHHVTQIDKSAVVTSAAYILFYSSL